MSTSNRWPEEGRVSERPIGMFERLKIFYAKRERGPGAPVEEDRIRLEPQRVLEPERASPAMIGAKITIKGEVSGEEDLRIEGKFEGTVNLPGHEVIVGETGRVSAQIKAKVVTVDGEVEGEIEGVEKVVISKTGRMHGNLAGPRLILEDGGVFTGRMDMNSPDAAKVTAPRTVQAADKPDDPAEETAD